MNCGINRSKYSVFSGSGWKTEKKLCYSTFVKSLNTRLKIHTT